jgi:4a-hydroxytetrahydrobiopterin dehydratase
MDALRDRNCKPVEKGTPPLDEATVKQLLGQLPGWSVVGGKLTKTFSFKNYYETTALANATFWVSHRQDHHPDIEIAYNKLTIRYDTHSIGGLSENDFICAARVQAMME